MAFDFQALCEIADRELNAGLADARLVERALAESGAVPARTREIFWRLRATELNRMQEATGEAPILELLSGITQQEERLRGREERHRWFWALACVAGMLGTLICPIFALRAYDKTGHQFSIMAVLGMASLLLTFTAVFASRYHTATD